MSNKKITYEIDESTDLIIQSLVGKSYMTSKDYKRILDSLIHNAYKTNKGKKII